jgi:hypothetical protein
MNSQIQMVLGLKYILEDFLIKKIYAQLITKLISWQNGPKFSIFLQTD